MKVVAMEKSDLRLSEVANVARSGTVIVTQNGEPLFSIKRLTADDRERMALAQNPKFRAIIAASRKSLRENGGLTTDEICREFGLRNPAKKPRRRAVAANVKAKR